LIALYNVDVANGERKRHTAWGKFCLGDFFLVPGEYPMAQRRVRVTPGHMLMTELGPEANSLVPGTTAM